MLCSQGLLCVLRLLRHPVVVLRLQQLQRMLSDAASVLPACTTLLQLSMHIISYFHHVVPLVL